MKNLRKSIAKTFINYLHHQNLADSGRIGSRPNVSADKNLMHFSRNTHF